jgi:hypothetical protein
MIASGRLLEFGTYEQWRKVERPHRVAGGKESGKQRAEKSLGLRRRIVAAYERGEKLGKREKLASIASALKVSVSTVSRHLAEHHKQRRP